MLLDFRTFLPAVGRQKSLSSWKHRQVQRIGCRVEHHGHSHRDRLILPMSAANRSSKSAADKTIFIYFNYNGSNCFWLINYIVFRVRKILGTIWAVEGLHRVLDKNIRFTVWLLTDRISGCASLRIPKVRRATLYEGDSKFLVFFFYLSELLKLSVYFSSSYTIISKSSIKYDGFD